MTREPDDAAHARTDARTSRRALLSRGASLAAAGALGACAGATRAGTGGAPKDALARRSDEIARIDEELASLSDQSASVPPIAASERSTRRSRAAALLAGAGLDAVLMEGGATMTYLTGVGWGRSERLFALALFADGTLLWIVPAFEASRARLQIDGDGPGGDLLAWQEHEHPYRPLAAALAERRVERLAIEPGLRHGFVDKLTACLGGARVVDGHPFVIELRACKDEHELALLRRANELTQLAIATVAQTLAPGMSGADIGARMDRAHRRLGLRNPWNLSLIGAASALPHGDPDARPLARGDVVLVDTGGGLHGYQSDITRTWVFDATPSRAVEAAWNAVRDAQRRAFDGMRPGVTCGSIDALARARIDELGYGPGYRTFTHRLGHGIGLEGHEDPYFDGGSSVVLARGMTLSNEPGIYLPGEFGVRIEDIVAITEHDVDHFGDWQKGPRAPA